MLSVSAAAVRFNASFAVGAVNAADGGGALCGVVLAAVNAVVVATSTAASCSAGRFGIA